MFTLKWTDHFTRAARKFIKFHPDQRNRLAKILRNLEQDPYQPQLRLHPPKGKLQGIYAVSLTLSHRIILTLMVTEKEIILLGIGSHDEVYR